MSNFQSYKTITDRLKSLGDKLSQNKLSNEELDEFESLSRQLYERAVILNYKAKEEKVHGEKKESIAVESNNLAVKEEDKTQVSEDTSDTGEIQFDFSNDMGDVEAQNEEEVQQEEAGIKEAEVQIENSITVDENSVEPETVKKTINESLDTDKEKSFYERFEKVHNESLGDKLGASKLSTLKNAIGLNDKMQFISELFDGDNDAFNKSIEALDQQPSNEDARKTLSQIASKHTWEEENPLVEEFARLIERRYVED